MRTILQFGRLLELQKKHGRISRILKTRNIQNATIVLLCLNEFQFSIRRLWYGTQYAEISQVVSLAIFAFALLPLWLTVKDHPEGWRGL